MAILSRFPAGEGLWLIRWIDEFRLAQSASVSASVRLLLQPLDLTREQLQGLSTAEVAALLAMKPDSTEVTHVLVGCLPGLAVGQVYQAGRFVCELPSTELMVDLPDGEVSCEVAEVRGHVTPPEKWKPVYPHITLTGPEFPGLPGRFEKSRCLVTNTPERAVVIPRLAIFRTFYAPHTELASAFTAGTYSQAMERLVYFGRLKNGLETRVDQETNEWHVIVQPNVENAYARLIAVLLFDTHARQCAEALYSESLMQRGGKASELWYANAKIPFHGPVRLKVKGFDLIAPKTRRLRRFLVTSILGINVPDYLPVIKFERANSNEDSDNPRDTTEPAPYPQAPSATPSPSQLKLDNDDDADASAQPFKHDVLSFDWLGAQPLEKIKKQSSQRHNAVRPVQVERARTGRGSSGEAKGGNRGASPTSVGTVIRKPIKSFGQLLGIFHRMVEVGWIDRFALYQPDDASRRTEQGGIACWNFLDEEMRETGKWPMRAWVMIRQGKQNADGSFTDPLPRAAMLIELRAGSRVALWAEIESRSNEGFRSPVIVSDRGDLSLDHGDLIDHIALKKGRNLGPALTPMATAARATVVTYKHIYDDEGVISFQSVARFLSHHFGFNPLRALVDSGRSERSES